MEDTSSKKSNLEKENKKVPKPATHQRSRSLGASKSQIVSTQLLKEKYFSQTTFDSMSQNLDMPIFPSLHQVPLPNLKSKWSPIMETSKFRQTQEEHKDAPKLSKPEVLEKNTQVQIQSFFIDKGYVGLTKKDGTREGEGKQYYSDGSMFIGYFYQDNPIKGYFYFPNGDVFIGVLLHNQFVEGKYIAFNREFEYTGTFSQGSFEGKGHLNWKSEINTHVPFKFAGNFVEGKWNGLGKLTYGDKIVNGFWVQGKFDQHIEPKEQNQSRNFNATDSLLLGPTSSLVRQEGKPNMFHKKDDIDQNKKKSKKSYLSAFAKDKEQATTNKYDRRVKPRKSASPTIQHLLRFKSKTIPRKVVEKEVSEKNDLITPFDSDKVKEDENYLSSDSIENEAELSHKLNDSRFSVSSDLHRRFSHKSQHPPFTSSAKQQKQSDFSKESQSATEISEVFNGKMVQVQRTLYSKNDELQMQNYKLVEQLLQTEQNIKSTLEAKQSEIDQMQQKYKIELQHSFEREHKTSKELAEERKHLKTQEETIKRHEQAIITIKQQHQAELQKSFQREHSLQQQLADEKKHFKLHEEVLKKQDITIVNLQHRLNDQTKQNDQLAATLECQTQKNEELKIKIAQLQKTHLKAQEQLSSQDEDREEMRKLRGQVVAYAMGRAQIQRRFETEKLQVQWLEEQLTLNKSNFEKQLQQVTETGDSRMQMVTKQFNQKILERKQQSQDLQNQLQAYTIFSTEEVSHLGKMIVALSVQKGQKKRLIESIQNDLFNKEANMTSLQQKQQLETQTNNQRFEEQEQTYVQKLEQMQLSMSNLKDQFDQKELQFQHHVEVSNQNEGKLHQEYQQLVQQSEERTLNAYKKIVCFAMARGQQIRLNQSHNLTSEQNKIYASKVILENEARIMELSKRLDKQYQEAQSFKTSQALKIKDLRKKCVAFALSKGIKERFMKKSSEEAQQNFTIQFNNQVQKFDIQAQKIKSIKTQAQSDKEKQDHELEVLTQTLQDQQQRSSHSHQSYEQLASQLRKKVVAFAVAKSMQKRKDEQIKNAQETKRIQLNMKIQDVQSEMASQQQEFEKLQDTLQGNILQAQKEAQTHQAVLEEQAALLRKKVIGIAIYRAMKQRNLTKDSQELLKEKQQMKIQLQDIQSMMISTNQDSQRQQLQMQQSLDSANQNAYLSQKTLEDKAAYLRKHLVAKCIVKEMKLRGLERQQRKLNSEYQQSSQKNNESEIIQQELMVETQDLKKQLKQVKAKAQSSEQSMSKYSAQLRKQIVAIAIKKAMQKRHDHLTSQNELQQQKISLDSQFNDFKQQSGIQKHNFDVELSKVNKNLQKAKQTQSSLESLASDLRLKLVSISIAKAFQKSRFNDQKSNLSAQISSIQSKLVQSEHSLQKLAVQNAEAEQMLVQKDDLIKLVRKAVVGVAIAKNMTNRNLKAQLTQCRHQLQETTRRAEKYCEVNTQLQYQVSIAKDEINQLRDAANTSEQEMNEQASELRVKVVGFAIAKAFQKSNFSKELGQNKRRIKELDLHLSERKQEWDFQMESFKSQIENQDKLYSSQKNQFTHQLESAEDLAKKLRIKAVAFALQNGFKQRKYLKLDQNCSKLSKKLQISKQTCFEAQDKLQLHRKQSEEYENNLNKKIVGTIILLGQQYRAQARNELKIDLLIQAQSRDRLEKAQLLGDIKKLRQQVVGFAISKAQRERKAISDQIKLHDQVLTAHNNQNQMRKQLTESQESMQKEQLIKDMQILTTSQEAQLAVENLKRESSDLRKKVLSTVMAKSMLKKRLQREIRVDQSKSSQQFESQVQKIQSQVGTQFDDFQKEKQLLNSKLEKVNKSAQQMKVTFERKISRLSKQFVGVAIQKSMKARIQEKQFILQQEAQQSALSQTFAEFQIKQQDLQSKNQSQKKQLKSLNQQLKTQSAKFETELQSQNVSLMVDQDSLNLCKQIVALQINKGQTSRVTKQHFEYQEKHFTDMYSEQLTKVQKENKNLYAQVSILTEQIKQDKSEFDRYKLDIQSVVVNEAKLKKTVSSLTNEKITFERQFSFGPNIQIQNSDKFKSISTQTYLEDQVQLRFLKQEEGQVHVSPNRKAQRSYGENKFNSDLANSSTRLSRSPLRNSKPGESVRFSKQQSTGSNDIIPSELSSPKQNEDSSKSPLRISFDRKSLSAIQDTSQASLADLKHQLYLEQRDSGEFGQQNSFLQELIKLREENTRLVAINTKLTQQSQILSSKCQELQRSQNELKETVCENFGKIESYFESQIIKILEQASIKTDVIQVLEASFKHQKVKNNQIKKEKTSQFQELHQRVNKDMEHLSEVQKQLKSKEDEVLSKEQFLKMQTSEIKSQQDALADQKHLFAFEQARTVMNLQLDHTRQRIKSSLSQSMNTDMKSQKSIDNLASLNISEIVKEADSRRKDKEQNLFENKLGAPLSPTLKVDKAKSYGSDTEEMDDINESSNQLPPPLIEKKVDQGHIQTQEDLPNQLSKTKSISHSSLFSFSKQKASASFVEKEENKNDNSLLGKLLESRDNVAKRVKSFSFI